MRSVRKHLSLAAILVSASLGVAGCATQQPWDLPDPYGHGASRSSPYYGSGSYGYGSGYGYGYGYRDPYANYSRPGVPLRYPAYGYYPYPYVPGNYCRDANRDGRCDHRRDDRDDDDADGGGPPRPGSDRPLRDVRRMLEEREQRTEPSAGAAPRPAAVRPAPSPRPAAGAAPTVRGTPAPSPPQPRAQPRQRSEPLQPATRRTPRAEPAPRSVDADPPISRR